MVILLIILVKILDRRSAQKKRLVREHLERNRAERQIMLVKDLHDSTVWNERHHHLVD